MNHQVNLTTPEPSPKRTAAINIRLTPEEFAQVEELADQLDVRVATMVRHFLMQAVESFSEETSASADI